MKKFLKYFLVLLAGFGLGIFGLIAIFALAISNFSHTKETTETPENSVITLTLPTQIESQGEENPLSEILGNSDETILGLNEIERIFNWASKDKKVKGIYLRPGMYSSGFAYADEIRSFILNFRKTGKWVIAYDNVYTEQGYYVASACNQIYINPAGMIEFNGLSSNIVMYSGMLKKLGIEPKVFRVGKFKGAVEPFIQNTLSEENKFQIKTYLESLYKHQISEISKTRNMSYDSLWNMAMSGLVYNAPTAVKKGILDKLAYENEAIDWISSKVKNYHLVSATKYLNTEDPTEYSENKIAVIYANGDIGDGKSESSDEIASESFVSMLKKVKNDKSIKAIVIRINSPGGSSLASDIMAHEIMLAKKVKPVVFSYGNVAASGGYYMSCIADSIFALPNTITGSIGVFALLANTQDLFSNKLGLGYETVNVGNMAELWRPDRDLTETQKILIQSEINRIYDDFISIVAKGRKLPKETVNELAQGRVYSGEDALKLKLIDGLGGLNRALLSAQRMAKLKSYRVAEYPEQSNFIDKLIKKTQNGEDAATQALLKFGINSKTIREIKTIQRLNGVQMHLPWSIEIN